MKIRKEENSAHQLKVNKSTEVSITDVWKG